MGKSLISSGHGKRERGEPPVRLDVPQPEPVELASASGAAPVPISTRAAAAAHTARVAGAAAAVQRHVEPEAGRESVGRQVQLQARWGDQSMGFIRQAVSS